MEFNDKQIELLKRLGVNSPKNLAELSDEEFFLIDDAVADHMMDCMDSNYKPNEEGRICESILDLLSELKYHLS
jgi:hypothetical protein